MDRIKEILEKGLYEDMSELDMQMCIYREFAKFDNDELKEKFVLKMLEKRPDKNFIGTMREQVAKDILYLDIYQENPPCFFDKRRVPTLEELDEFTPEEMDYLANMVSVTGRFYGNIIRHRQEENRQKKIRAVLNEYWGNYNNAKH